MAVEAIVSLLETLEEAAEREEELEEEEEEGDETLRVRIEALWLELEVSSGR